MAVKFGISLGGSEGVVSCAREAEALGYDYLTGGDHVTFRGREMPSVIPQLAVAAGATERIRLMSTILLLPLYNPVIVAKQTSVLDVACGGRFELGIGVGGESPKEFEACGIPVKQRGSRANESLEIIRRLWTEDNVTINGRYNKFEQVTLLPKPLQKPNPPIWVSGRREPAMRRAARYGDGWLPYVYSPEQLSSSIETVNRMGAEEGRDMRNFRFGIYIFASVYADGSEALRSVGEEMPPDYFKDFARDAARYNLFGDPEYCRKRLGDYIEAGAQTVIFVIRSRPADRLDNVRRIAREVIPAFR